MPITASLISAAQNPNDPNGTVVTFTRSDTGEQVTLPVSIPWSTDSTAQNLALFRADIMAWEAQANSLSAANAAAVGLTI